MSKYKIGEKVYVEMEIASINRLAGGRVEYSLRTSDAMKKVQGLFWVPEEILFIRKSAPAPKPPVEEPKKKKWIFF